jgi:hypothetical protein
MTYLAGLSLLAIAVVVWLGKWETPGSSQRWLASAAAGLGFGLWCEVFATHFGAPKLGMSLRVVLWSVALAALCETSRQFGGPSRRWLLARRGWLVLPLVGIVAVAWNLGLADILLRGLIAWEGGLTAARSLGLQIRRQGFDHDQPLLMLFVATVILAGGVAANSALVSAIAATLVCGLLGQQAIAACATGRRIRQLAGAGTFLLLSAGGWFLGPSAGEAAVDQGFPTEILLVTGTNSSESAAGTEKTFVDVLQKSVATSEASASPFKSRAATQLGWGLLGLGAFVAVIWAISKLPFVH